MNEGFTLILLAITILVPLIIGISSGADEGGKAFFIILLLQALGFGGMMIFNS